jgi:hypothetical protein
MNSSPPVPKTLTAQQWLDLLEPLKPSLHWWENQSNFENQTTLTSASGGTLLSVDAPSSSAWTVSSIGSLPSVISDTDLQSWTAPTTGYFSTTTGTSFSSAGRGPQEDGTESLCRKCGDRDRWKTISTHFDWCLNCYAKELTKYIGNKSEPTHNELGEIAP